MKKILLVVRFFSFFLRLVGTFALFLYLMLSILTWVSSRAVMDDELTNLRGLFILSSSLFLIMVTLMISLYIHVEESRAPAVQENPDPGTLMAQRPSPKHGSRFLAQSAGSIGIALLAVVAGVVNFWQVEAVESEEIEVVSTLDEPIQAPSQVGEDDIRKGLSVARNEWPFLEKYLQVENVKVNGGNEIPDSDYYVFFVQNDNILVVSYMLTFGTEASTILVDLKTSQLVSSHRFYVTKYHPETKEMEILRQYIDMERQSRIFTEGTMNLESFTVIWGPEHD